MRCLYRAIYLIINFDTHRLQCPAWMSSVKENFATRIQCLPCSRDVNIRAVTPAMCA
jgi:hypothetical protein